MKKHLLLASLFATAGLSMLAQNSGRVLTPTTMENAARPKSATRNTTCTADTLRYGLVKEYALNATPQFFAAPLTGPGEQQAQAYISTETVNIVGVDFRAKIDGANGTAVVPVRAYLYDVDALLMPTVALDSALVTVSGTASKYYHANFAVPHAVTGNYAVAIRPTLAFKVDFILNNRAAGTGGEGLGFNYWDPGLGGQWFANGDATNGWGQDFDALISPIVTYPIATDYTVSPSATVCLGTPMTFTNTTTPSSNLGNRMYNYNAFAAYFGAPAVADSTYGWDMGDGSAAIWSKDATYTYPAAGTNTVTLYTLAGFWNSCVDTKATSVTINSDDASISNPGTVCEGAAAFNLTAATSGGTWSGTGITDATLGTFDPTVAGVGSQTITYTTNGTCPATGSVSVAVTAMDDATITAPATLCEGDAPVTLTAVTSGGTWSGTGITSASAGTFDPATATAGTYTITYVTNGLCPDTDNASITVNQTDDATIADPGMICDNDSPLTLTAATAGGTWSGSGITDANAGTFDPASVGAGSYAISYTTAGACPGTDMITLTVSVCTGVQTHAAAATLSVYPNPSTGVFNLDLGVNSKSTVEVYNVIGAKVIAKEVNVQVSTLDMSGFEAGVYFLKVTTGNNKVTKKITLTK